MQLISLLASGLDRNTMQGQVLAQGLLELHANVATYSTSIITLLDRLVAEARLRLVTLQPANTAPAHLPTLSPSLPPKFTLRVTMPSKHRFKTFVQSMLGCSNNCQRH